MMLEINIGSEIKGLRKKQGLSQRELASRLGLSTQRICFIENSEGDIGFNLTRRILHELDHDILIIKTPKIK
mgnify:CR=1 FL=1